MKIARKAISILSAIALCASMAAGAFAAPPGGGSSSSVSWSGANTITSSTTESGKTYTSTSADENALLINTTGTVTITNPTVTKSGGTSASDNYSFYGINSGVMVKGGGTANISGGTITTTAAGANGVFSYGANSGSTNATGDGTTVNISDTVITTTGNGSGGIMTTYGGTTNASNLTITTSGGSSAPIRTDRGGGWVTVDGGTYTSNGLGSPAIYSTADVKVSNATLVSNKSEGVCIEGTGSIELTDCDLTATNNALNGNATFYDTIMIYQSMSGDADSGSSHFTMTGGKLTSNNGHVFHVTNTNAVITLSGVDIVNNDSDNVLLSVCDDGWSGGSNIAALNADGQTLEGTILVGSDSTLTMSLADGSVYTGAISGSITNGKGASVSSSVGKVSVTLDSTSKWVLTADTYISSFSGSAANVISNGYTLYVNGTALSGTTESESTAEETPSSWAVEEVSAAIELGLVPENLQKNYTSEVSRADVAELFINLITEASGKSVSTLLSENGAEIDQSAFTDTTDYNVFAANALGLINGIGNSKFGPDYSLTRAQLAAILTRCAKLLGTDTSGYTHSFTDVSDHWVDSELGWAATVNVFKGVGTGEFKPDDALTVEQAIAVTYRALQVLKG
ncbi:MAG: S-layer homology domain-containing protein [Oscillospiraceae bacterium]|nr:S-layer homology domain-containing protein [Oscillospiraceae bacterium]